MSAWDVLYDSLLAPALIAGFRVAALGNGKIRDGLKMRAPDASGAPPWLQGPQGLKPVWIHCASGELEYAKPVIQELKRRDPGQKILVTYFSPSVKAAVERLAGIDLHSPSPWDRGADVAALIRHHQPRALLIARTDAWPAMVREARRHGVPSLLFSATLAGSSGRLKPIARPLSRWALGGLDEIFCVSDDDRDGFASLGLEDKTKVAGDTRFDQVCARLAAPKETKPLFASLPGTRVLVAGSTWAEDEAELVPVIARLRGRCKFVVAPHEPSEAHLAALEARLRAAGLRSLRYSEAGRIDGTVDAIVVDVVGILAELYLSGDFAFVGGSFRKTVHSVMEPLGAGCPTFVGPLHWNNREALEFARIPLPGARSGTAVTPVSGGADWGARLADALEAGPEAAERWKAFIRREIESRSGKSGFVVDWVLARRR